MKLVPVTNRTAARAAIAALQKKLRKGSIPFNRTIGFRPSTLSATVLWRPDEQFWFYFNPKATGNRYWCCYGAQDPAKNQSLNISVEINPPFGGFHRNIAGVLLMDAATSVYLAHSGRVGGGKPGVGKTEFLNFCTGMETATVQWPDGIETELVLIGKVDDAHLPQQIGAFVSEVYSFKTSTARPSPPASKDGHGRYFSPEFEGNRKAYVLTKTVSGRCDHGVVVRTLRSALSRIGQTYYNDRNRDLFALGRSDKISVLVEVKTSTHVDDLYAGVGQLMVNGAHEEKDLRRVLVVPEGLTTTYRKLLRDIGIELATYRWKDNTVVFNGIGVFQSAT